MNNSPITPATVNGQGYFGVPTSAGRSSTWRFSGSQTREYFVSEASAYGLFKAHDADHQPRLCGDQGGERVQGQTTSINQLWQTDFTYLKIKGWGWYYLSMVLDDFSRYIEARRLGPTMCASDVTATLD